MAQYTQLSVMGLPGQVHTFLAKTNATIMLQNEWDYETQSNSTLVLKTEVDSMELEPTITSIIMKTGY